MSNYEIYQIHGALTVEGLRAAVARFVQRNGRLPHAIAAHHTNTQRLRVLLLELKLDIPVHDNGGVLAYELWMQTNDVHKEMTPHE
jgi:hypothetical protein